MVEQSFSGPIPPPAMLEQYNQVSPGAADRIIAMAEKEQSHRHAQEDAINAGNICALQTEQGLQKTGQVFAFIIAIISFLCGTGLIASGHSVIGTIFAGAPIATMLYGFLRTPRPQKDNHDKDA